MNPILDSAQVFYHKICNPLAYKEDSIPSVNEMLFQDLLCDLPNYDRRTLRRERYSIVVKRSVPDNIDEKTITTYKVTMINNVLKSSKYLFDTLTNTTHRNKSTPAVTFNIRTLQSNIKRLGF